MTTTPANATPADALRRARVRRTVLVLVIAALASYSLLFVMAARA
ncbi:MAG: hypothetical protein ACREO3_07270 [Arenimonas sp.]